MSSPSSVIHCGQKFSLLDTQSPDKEEILRALDRVFGFDSGHIPFIALDGSIVSITASEDDVGKTIATMDKLATIAAAQATAVSRGMYSDNPKKISYDFKSLAELAECINEFVRCHDRHANTATLSCLITPCASFLKR